jgi:hypothetical protein
MDDGGRYAYDVRALDPIRERTLWAVYRSRGHPSKLTTIPRDYELYDEGYPVSEADVPRAVEMLLTLVSDDVQICIEKII